MYICISPTRSRVVGPRLLPDEISPLNNYKRAKIIKASDSRMPWRRGAPRWSGAVPNRAFDGVKGRSSNGFPEPGSTLT